MAASNATKTPPGPDPHAVIQMINTASGGAVKGAKVLKVISGLQAYNQFDWIKGVPVTNAAGNFRGMVIST